MSRSHIDHKEICLFAEARVNLPRDKANEYRAQAARLREKLEGYLSEHPDLPLTSGNSAQQVDGCPRGTRQH